MTSEQLQDIGAAVTAMAFVSRFRKKSAVTLEQVRRSLKLLCRKISNRPCGTSETQSLPDLLQYHQRRNEAARISRRKRKRNLKKFDAM